MKCQRVSFGLCAAFGIVLLILDSKTSFLGASNGILLCLRTVIPVLFPFFFFSNLLVNSLWGFQHPVMQAIGQVFRLPKGTESILVPAFLGGYPAGAQAISSLYEMHSLSKDQAEHMLAFCNNAGPSFIFGLVASAFTERSVGWLIWGIQILGALIAAQSFPSLAPTKNIELNQRRVSIASSMNSALTATAKACGWVILFRIFLTFFSPVLGTLSPALNTLFTGLLELSNGCCQLQTISNWGVRLIVANIILSSGGLCVAMQTVSVTGDLSLKWYVKGKIIQLISTIFLSIAIIMGKPWLIVASLILFIFFFQRQNNSSIHKKLGV